MLESVSQILEVLKKVVLYVGVPVGSVVAYFFHLKYKIAALEARVEAIKESQELANILAKKEEVANAAAKAETDYRKLVSGTISSSTNQSK